MDCNKTYTQARKLTYIEFHTQFVWKSQERHWEPRKKGFSIGRIDHVSPKVGEAYYLRILLNKVRGPTSFEDICIVNGRLYDTFRDTCYAFGLLDDDKEYIDAIEETSYTGSGYYIRMLFAMMLMSDSLSRIDFVWEQTWQYLSNGIRFEPQSKLKCPGLSLTEDQIRNMTFLEIEIILVHNILSLKNFQMMPCPDHDSIASSNNRLILGELAYDRSTLQIEFNQLYVSITDEQRGVFYSVIKAVNTNQGGVFFVYGYGGTGKTLVWKTLSTSIRSKGQIVLNVSSSGIASLLLTGGRTSYSRFLIPINLNEDSLYFIKSDNDTASLLRKTELIIWDEAPMAHKHAFEALDRSLKDIFISKKPFGGKVIIFGGDLDKFFLLFLMEVCTTSLMHHYVYLIYGTHCKVLTLTKNMRLTVECELCKLEQIMQFGDWILDIEEGKVGGANDGEAIIDIPEDLLINDSADPIGSLIQFFYPCILENMKNPKFFQDKEILVPTHEVVDIIIDRLLLVFSGDEKEYLSSGCICESENIHGNLNEGLYSPDVLNGLKLSGLPNHKLILKVGVPVMLLRNIDQQNGLCNETRLQVISMGDSVIEAEIISGNNIGTRTFIPRIRLTPSDKRIPFKVQRKQFSLAVCFAMTINKNQGQSLSNVGLFLKEPVFTHGQLYIVLSRVKSREGLKVLI